MENRRQRYPKLYLILAGVFLFVWPVAMSGQQSAAPVSGRSRLLPQSGVFLVFPFENAGASPRLDWIGAGLEELTIQKLSAAGQQVFSHEGRLDEMDRAGLPPNAKLSRATMLHIAQELDADYVVFGNFTSDGTSLTVNARVPPTNQRSVEAIFATGVCHLRLSQPDKAEKVFTKLQEDLKLSMVSGAELPEISNNLALALARQGKIAGAIPALSRARDLDPH